MYEIPNVKLKIAGILMSSGQKVKCARPEWRGAKGVEMKTGRAPTRVHSRPLVCA
jgi:hypothetical protein